MKRMAKEDAGEVAGTGEMSEMQKLLVVLENMVARRKTT